MWWCRWAFSIWGVIFALEGVGTVYQLMPHGYTPDGWKQRIVNSVGERDTARGAVWGQHVHRAAQTGLILRQVIEMQTWSDMC